MKTFKSFLEESKIDLDSLTEQIKTECSPFIKSIKRSGAKGSYFFRGLKNKSMFGKNVNTLIFEPEIVQGKIRSDRHPDSTPQLVHEIVDDYFEKQFGHRYRSNALFVTGDENDASQYGKVFMILPIGEFKCLTSYNIGDLYLKIVPKGLKSLASFLKTFISLDTDKALGIVGNILIKNGLMNAKDLSDSSKITSIFMQLFEIEQDGDDELNALDEIFNTYVFPKCKYFETDDAFKAIDTLNEVMIYCPNGWYGIEDTKEGRQLFKRIIE